MIVSDALSRLHIEANEKLYDVIPLNFLQHLNTEHIHYNYRHLAYILYKYKAKQQEQVITKPKRGCSPKPPTPTKWSPQSA